MTRPGHVDHTKPVTGGIRNQYAGLRRLRSFDETFQCFGRYHAGCQTTLRGCHINVHTGPNGKRNKMNKSEK